MATANPAMRAPTALVPYYRRYELPWSPSEETERRFRVILRNLGIAATIVAIILYFLPHAERVNNTESLPERVVQLVIQPPPPPPPPPPPKPEKPLEKVPETKAPPVPVDPRIKASKSGLLASMDDLAALRDQIDLDKFAKNQKNTTDPGDVSTVTRSLITSKAGGTSGGISAPTSSGLASGSGSLKGIYTTQVKDPNLGAGGQAATRAGGSGKASRSADEIALVFTKNKGAIDAMYARALRDNPALQGKVVIELTIAPSGDITAAKIISTELNDPEFESKLLARIRLFKFEAKDVAALTATKPIDFFPAG
ncbi:MAG TPA: AgmX/PglI C-terminal domain-containing protein [Steroidobacteraceae bacterium]|jgi:protein TonB|nr:AgmX/PglI C-terminal domain-containing protein [Steroidobacteraceae bacterium]